jgi:anti-sigma regulatory factor (Ser/Thr protein kinase)
MDESPRELSFEVPSELEHMAPAWERVEALALQQGWQRGERLENLHLAFIEGLTNVILHAHGKDGRPAPIEVFVSKEKIEIHLYDTGPGTEWPDAEPEVPDVLAESGRGIFLIFTLTDESSYQRKADGNLLTIIQCC